MKLISLNTWGGKIFNPLMDFVKQHSTDTDIFCFQEMFNTKSNIIEQVGFRLNLYSEISKILADYQGYFHPCTENYVAGSFQRNLVDFNLSWGQSIFVSKKTKITSQGDFFVFGNKTSFNPKDENSVPRNVQYISFLYHGTQYTVGNLHGVWVRGPKIDTPARIKQSEMIKAFLDQQKGEKILVGDFNLDINTKSIKILESNFRNLIKEYNISSTRSKHYGKTDDKFADYIFISSEVTVKNFTVPDIEVSDHLPLILEFL